MLFREVRYVDGRAGLLHQVSIALGELYPNAEFYDTLMSEGVVQVLADIGGRRREGPQQCEALWGTRWHALHALWNFMFARDGRFYEALLEPIVLDILVRIAGDPEESPDLRTQVRISPPILLGVGRMRCQR
jgi:hypothetical protein